MKHWSTGTAILIKSAEDTSQNKRQRVAFRREAFATLYAWEDGTALIVGDSGEITEEQHGTQEAAMKRLNEY